MPSLLSSILCKQSYTHFINRSKFKSTRWFTKRKPISFEAIYLFEHAIKIATEEVSDGKRRMNKLINKNRWFTQFNHKDLFIMKEIIE